MKEGRRLAQMERAPEMKEGRRLAIKGTGA